MTDTTQDAGQQLLDYSVRSMKFMSSLNDTTPITPQWLVYCGWIDFAAVAWDGNPRGMRQVTHFVPPSKGGEQVHYQQIQYQPYRNQLVVGEMRIANPTRGQVRALCFALGIELKE
jgi:hypothetical protein